MVLCFMVDRDNKEIVICPIMGLFLQFSESACVTFGTSSKIRGWWGIIIHFTYPVDWVVRVNIYSVRLNYFKSAFCLVPVNPADFCLLLCLLYICYNIQNFCIHDMNTCTSHPLYHTLFWNTSAFFMRNTSWFFHLDANNTNVINKLASGEQSADVILTFI